ncbi:hypothetical protein SMMN14_08022 [Sphaerulina musiva]
MFCARTTKLVEVFIGTPTRAERNSSQVSWRPLEMFQGMEAGGLPIGARRYREAEGKRISYAMTTAEPNGRAV